MVKKFGLRSWPYFIAVLLLVIIGGTQLFAQRPLFLARREFRTRDGSSIGPVAVAAGRFRGPSFPLDLAVANAYSSDISILFGDGRGGFTLDRVYPVYNYPFHVIAKDFNNDGVLDLAVANMEGIPPDTFVSVLLGDPNNPGKFLPRVDYRVPDAASTVAAEDFNNDGFLDLAVAVLGDFIPDFRGCDQPCRSNTTISVLLNNGNGTFGPAQNFPVGCAPEGIAAADLNGDFNVDIVSANLFSCNMSVLLGDGTGNFPPPRTDVTMGERPSTAILSDFNNDGKLDLATINEMTRTVSVALGDGTGRFAPPTHCAIPGGLRVVEADFDMDGNTDIAVAGGLTNKVFILRGDGTGNFIGCPIPADRPPAFDSGPMTANLAVGDFNGDDLLDIAAADKGAPEPPGLGNVSVLTGDGYANFGNFLKLDPIPAHVTVGDVNFPPDGKPDLVVAQMEANSVRVLLGDGLGGFTLGQTFAVQTNPIDVVIADFNNDQKPDLAVANFGSNSVSVLLGNGDGTFQTAIHTAVGAQSPNALVAGDFDCDGKQDLAIVNTASNNVRILYGNGNGTFTRARTLTAGGMLEPISIIKGNFGSGRSDLAVINRSSNNVSVFLADGCSASSGFVARPNLPLAPGANPSAINSGDFNRDGKMDLAVANNGLNTVSVFFGNGDGTFRPPVNISVGTEPSSLSVADYNGDGKLDLAVANIGSDNVSVLLGGGDGSFSPAIGSPFFVGSGPVSIATGDLNSLIDLRPDLVIADLGSGVISILLNNGP